MNFLHSRFYKWECKKIIFFLTFVTAFFTPNFVHSFSFSVSPVITYSKESITDKIYDGDYLHSMLEWESFYIFKAGAAAEIEHKNLSFQSSAKFNLPLKCGLQYDSDWYTPGIKTNFSTGNLYTSLGFDINFELKYKFNLPFGFSVFPVTSFYSSYVQLEAQDIYSWCGDAAHTGLNQDYSWDSEYAKRVKKYGINLNSLTTLVCFGAEIKKDFEKFYLDTKILVAPYLSIISVDHHLGKDGGKYYQMEHEAFFTAWNFDFTGGYFINKHNSINLNLNVNFCPEIQGKLFFGWFKIGKVLAPETSTFQFTKFSANLFWQYTF